MWKLLRVTQIIFLFIIKFTLKSRYKSGYAMVFNRTVMKLPEIANISLKIVTK